jgi:hypothetical protein
MTALCPAGGTSSPKLGASEFVTYSSGLLAAIFGAYDLVWLIPVIPFVGLAPLELNVFCATDPPSMPSFTSDESDALLQLRFGSDFDSGLSKLVDLAKRLIWNEACECDSGTATAPVPPTPPSGTPIIQVPAVSNTPCGSYTAFGPSNVQSFSSGGSRFDLMTAPWTIPKVTSALVTFHTSIQTGAGIGLVLILSVRNSANATLGPKLTVTLPVTGTTQVVIPIPTGGDRLWMQYDPPGGTTRIENIDWVVDYYCGPTLGTAGDCCTDPLVLSGIENILRVVTLIQRQNVAFGSIDKASHTGVSGDGELDIQGLIGVRVDVTTLPSRAGVSAGDPNTIWGIGWVRFGTADAWSGRQFIDADPWQSLPTQAGIYTRLGYSIPADVEVTLVELEREP